MSGELFPDHGIQPLRTSREPTSIRPQVSSQGSSSIHRRESSHPSTSASRSSGPYARPDQSSFDGSAHNVKASSTTSEFTKRKNWSQHIIDEIQDFMHVLSPTGAIMFCTPSIRELTGWTPEEAVGKPISDFIHADDIEGFSRDFQNSLRDGNDLTLYYRFRMKDDRYIIFEITGHPYYAEENGQQQCKCFFAMGRPYPSKNTAMLDSFLELKIENERLRQELHDMYTDMESGGDGTGQGGRGSPVDYGPPSNIDYSNSRRSSNPYQAGLQQSQYDRSPQMGGGSSVLAHGPANTSASHGALGIGISNTGNKGDMSQGSEKKKKARVEEGEFVCRDCGTVDSPEWRKGPEGPKSLCNACGLRYAKLKSKGDKLEKKK